MSHPIPAIKPLQDRNVLTGLAILAISLIIFASTTNISAVDIDVFSEAFFANFGLTIAYFIFLLVTNRQRNGKLLRFSNFAANVILLQLFNISAYSLNRTLPVFQLAADWVLAFLIISNSLLLLHALWRNFRPHFLNYLIVISSGVGLLFHLYESIYVVPIYPIALAGFWFFGISLHILVPLLYVLVFIKVLRGYLKKTARYWPAVSLSWAICLGFLIWASMRFAGINSILEKEFHHTHQAYQEKDLPAWVSSSQELKKDWITKRALLCGLSYTSAENGFRTFENTRFDERIKHDPLVVIASFFGGEMDLAVSDRINILRYMYDAPPSDRKKIMEWR